jgi:sec-independent protein translocase protein TatA
VVRHDLSFQRGRTQFRPPQPFEPELRSSMVFGLSIWKLLIGLAVVLLLFGHRLPLVARSLGQSVGEFKKGMEEDDPTVDKLDRK